MHPKGGTRKPSADSMPGSRVFRARALPGCLRPLFTTTQHHGHPSRGGRFTEAPAVMEKRCGVEGNALGNAPKSGDNTAEASFRAHGLPGVRMPYAVCGLALCLSHPSRAGIKPGRRFSMAETYHGGCFCVRWE
jgi:hypothetical protein